jgi:hypothetical protein
LQHTHIHSLPSSTSLLSIQKFTATLLSNHLHLPSLPVAGQPLQSHKGMSHPPHTLPKTFTNPQLPCPIAFFLQPPTPALPQPPPQHHPPTQSSITPRHVPPL